MAAIVTKRPQLKRAISQNFWTQGMAAFHNMGMGIMMR